MSDTPERSLDEVLRGLRVEYIGEAPERVRELSSALGRLRAGERDALDELLRCFHRLAGSGGSYGFPSITERSRAAEDAVRQLSAGDRPLERLDFALLEKHVLDVADAFAAAQRQLDQDRSSA
jgi:HPt (histidine-containing phosphotransfer) domain-containing protein